MSVQVEASPLFLHTLMYLFHNYTLSSLSNTVYSSIFPRWFPKISTCLSKIVGYFLDKRNQTRVLNNTLIYFRLSILVLSPHLSSLSLNLYISILLLLHHPSFYLLIIPLIWESFSTCCCRSLLSLSSRRLWYCERILLVCCSWERSLFSYSSSFLWDMISRSFREWISSSYSFTWDRQREEKALEIENGWAIVIHVDKSPWNREATTLLSSVH